MRTLSILALLCPALLLTAACSDGADDVAGPVHKVGSAGSAGAKVGADAGKDSGKQDAHLLETGVKEAGTEKCGNGLDDNDNGAIDENCPCKPGDKQKCFDGLPEQAGIGPCKYGQQTCAATTGSGEFQGGAWGPCTGSGEPGVELCNGADDDCDGKVDDDCGCVQGATEECSTICGKGKKTCLGGNQWSACDAPTPKAEECDGVDNDCDGTTDEDLSKPCSTVCGSGTQTCVAGAWQACSAPAPANGSAVASRSPWQMHTGQGVINFGQCFSQHGDKQEYNWASIPDANDGGWVAAPNSDIIGYSIPSTLCGVADCLCGGDYTYFRTFVTVEAGATLGTLTITMSGMDDGVRTTIFNSAYPGGATVDEGYVYLGGSATANLVPYIKAGEVNTIVLTHVDDCCSESNLQHAEVVIDGQTVQKCP